MAAWSRNKFFDKNKHFEGKWCDHKASLFALISYGCPGIKNIWEEKLNNEAAIYGNFLYPFEGLEVKSLEEKLNRSNLK